MTYIAITDAEIWTVRAICDAASPAPWQAIVEGRDQSGGDSFVMIGPPEHRQEDMYVTRDSHLAAAADLDFIAAARNYLPRLLDEIEHLRLRQP
jgi:hypothetical protein